MKATWRSSLVAVFLLCAQCIGVAVADDKILVKGKITEYSADKKTLVVAVDGGKSITFVVQDSKAMGLLDDQLFVGDEVKIHYLAKDGKNLINDAGDLKSARPGC